MPGQIRVIAVIENVGDHDLNILGPPGGDVMVDGTRYQHKDSVIMDGNITLRVNDVAAHAIDLSGLIADGGLHRVEYQLGTANSNQLSLQVPPGNRGRLGFAELLRTDFTVHKNGSWDARGKSSGRIRSLRSNGQTARVKRVLPIPSKLFLE